MTIPLNHWHEQYIFIKYKDIADQIVVMLGYSLYILFLLLRLLLFTVKVVKLHSPNQYV